MEQNQIVDTINLGINTALANMHTCTIAKVTAVNDTTIDCKPVFNRLDKDRDIELPVFSEVPIINLQGGESYQAFPVSVGDYALLFFTERCFDGWYNGQDNILPLEYRMHDYSDGFALVGVNNLGGAITIPSVIQQTGEKNHDGKATHQGDREHVGDNDQLGTYNLVGNMTITGDGGPGTANMTNITINITTGDIIADGISLKNHTHPGVQAGSSDTGAAQ